MLVPVSNHAKWCRRHPGKRENPLRAHTRLLPKHTQGATAWLLPRELASWQPADCSPTPAYSQILCSPRALQVPTGQPSLHLLPPASTIRFAIWEFKNITCDHFISGHSRKTRASIPEKICLLPQTPIPFRKCPEFLDWAGGVGTRGLSSYKSCSDDTRDQLLFRKGTSSEEGALLCGLAGPCPARWCLVFFFKKDRAGVLNSEMRTWLNSGPFM